MRTALLSWKLALGGLFAALLVAGGGGAWWYRTSRPAYRVEAAQDALRRGDWDEAQRLLELVAAAGHRDEACLLRGDLCYRTGRPIEAIRELNTIQSQGPVRVRAASLGGWCYLALWNYWEASRHFRYALDQDGDNLSAHRGLARVYYHQGALAYAEEHLEAVTRLDPANGEAWQALGVIHKDLDKNRVRAVECFEAALRRVLSRADRGAVRLDLAALHFKTGNPAAALEILDGLDPQTAATNPVALALRAECLEAQQQHAAACDLLERSLKDHPQAVELLRVRAVLALHDDKFAEAASDLETVLATNRHDYATRFQLAQALELLGKRGEAAEQRRRVDESRKLLGELTSLNSQVTVKPWDAQLQHRLADVCERLDKHDLAAMWRRAASASPTR